MEDCSFHAAQTTTVAVYVCSLSSRQRCGVCELEWNRICCRDNHTRGVPPSLENKCSRPITEQHAVEDARKDESPSSWQCTSFYFPLQSHSKLSTTEWFVGPGLDLTLFILHILLLQSLKIKRSEKCFFKRSKAPVSWQMWRYLNQRKICPPGDLQTSPALKWVTISNRSPPLSVQMCPHKKLWPDPGKQPA